MNNYLFNFKLFISFLLGIILSFSLPPYNFTILSFLVFPFLLHLLVLSKDCSGKVIFFIGYLFGFGYFLSSLYWISFSLNFDDNLKILKPLVLFFIPSILALFYAISCLLIKKFISQSFYFILIFSTVFASIEFIRGFVFTGFPWNLFVYTWSWSLESVQILSYVGTYSFNFLSLILFCSFFLVSFRTGYKNFFIIISTIFLVLLCNYYFGLYSIKKNYLTKVPNFKIVILQPNQNIEELQKDNGYSLYIDKLINLSNPKKYNNQNTLFVWPEGVFVNSEDIRQYSDLFANNFSSNHQIVLGSTKYKGEKFYNSFFLVNNSAKIITSYDKINLVPFGEFIPFYNFFEKINLKKITFGYGSFSSGQNRFPIKIENGLNFLPILCYEVIFSGKINLDKTNYDFIINISEDGWFGKSIGTIQHFVHSQYRAIEEGKHIVRSTNQGISASIKPNGIVDSSINFNKTLSIAVDIYKKNEKTLFSIYSNKVFYLLIFLSSVFLFWFKKRDE